MELSITTYFITNDNIVLPLNNIILNIQYINYFIDLIDILIRIILLFILIIDKVIDIIYNYVIYYERKI